MLIVPPAGTLGANWLDRRINTDVWRAKVDQRLDTIDGRQASAEKIRAAELETARIRERDAQAFQRAVIDRLARIETKVADRDARRP